MTPDDDKPRPDDDSPPVDVTDAPPADGAGEPPADPLVPGGPQDVPSAPRPSDALRVKLEAFEGPLDLLLHLIRREKIDIADIPIAHITHDYLETIQTMQLLNLEVAGEFLVMAATLMRIKSRTLLPPSPLDEDEEEGGDPREELVRRLLEYRKFKEVAGQLRAQEEARARHHGKGYTPRVESTEPMPLKPTSLFRLVDVLREVLARHREQEPVHEVTLPPVTTEERMEHIREMVAGAWGQIRFEELLADCRERIQVITTFIALLELIKLGEIVARQYDEFGDIWIFDPERLGVADDATFTGWRAHRQQQAADSREAGDEPEVET